MDKTLARLLAIFFLTFGVFISVVVFNKPLSRLIRASQQTNISPTTSLILAWPLTVKADGVSFSTITVFLRNEKNYPVANKPVSISTTLGEVKQTQQTTTKDGKAEFQLISSTPGTAVITANAEGQTLSQTVSVKFE